MSTAPSSPIRLGVLAALAVAGAFSLLPGRLDAAEGDAIRPFRINVSEAQLVDLRQRIAATRWPDRETVADGSQGNHLGTIQD